jgi:hypothetical protein
VVAKEQGGCGQFEPTSIVREFMSQLQWSACVPGRAVDLLAVDRHGYQQKDQGGHGQSEKTSILIEVLQCI